jgi:membrane protease YdiL (CAAX protease family)
MFSLSVIWIILAILMAVGMTLFLHGQLPFFTLLWLCIPLIVVLRKRDARRIGFSMVKRKDFILATGVCVIAQFVISALCEPWSHAGQTLYNMALSSQPPDNTFLLLHFGGFAGWSGMIIFSALVTLFAEELFFRGWLQQLLLHRFRSGWAILIQATLFTILVNLLVALSMPPMQAVINLVAYSWLAIGIVNGWAAVRTKSIWPGLIAVILSNLVGTISALR